MNIQAMMKQAQQLQKNMVEEKKKIDEMEFEGKMFPVPRQTDAVLRKIYGDYMQLPDLENIHPHYNKLEFYK